MSNPPPLRLPQKFANDPELRRYFEDQNMFLLLLWRQLNDTSDAVGDIDTTPAQAVSDNSMLLMGA